MIIFVGGVVGAGKSSVAKKLAEKLDFYYYDIDEIKKVVYQEDPDFEHNMLLGIPFKDETRGQVFDRVVKDFSRLQKTHDHIVVDETLHKRKLRNILFDGAKKYFGKYYVVWVDADEDVIEGRLSSQVREGHILDDPMKMHRAFVKEFENFHQSIIQCRNNKTLNETVDDLMRLFRNVGQLET